MKILFVCTGNTCRSPMAEVLAQKIIGAKHEFSSAGISAFNGAGVSENAVTAMENTNCNISNYKSRQITKDLLCESNLVLTMTKSHKNSVLTHFIDVPDMNKKIYTLNEYALDKDCDIKDPYALGLDDYMNCAEEIKIAIQALKIKLDSFES